MLLPHRYCRPPPGIPPGTMSSAGQSAANRAATSGGEKTRQESYVILKYHRHPKYCHRTLEYYTKRSEGMELQLSYHPSPGILMSSKNIQKIYEAPFKKDPE